MLHTLNLYSAVCQLHVYKTGGKKSLEIFQYTVGAPYLGVPHPQTQPTSH